MTKITSGGAKQPTIKLLHTPWDSFFKASMLDKETVLSIIQRYTKPEFLIWYDLNSLCSRPVQFIDSVGRVEYRGDAVFQMRTKEGNGLVLFIIEHQSYVDKKMSWRLYHYSVNHMNNTFIESGVLPVVVPIVIYHGEKPLEKMALPWLNLFEPQGLRQLIQQQSAHGFLHEPVYSDLSSYTDEQISSHGRAALMETVLRNSRKSPDEQIRRLFRVLFSGDYPLEMQTDTVGFVCDILRLRNKQELIDHVKAMNDPDSAIYVEGIMNVVEQIELHGFTAGRNAGRHEGIAEGRVKGIAEGKAKGIAEGKAKGIAEGMAEGKAKGMAEGKAETALNLLNEGFNEELVSRVTGLSQADLRNIRSLY